MGDQPVTVTPKYKFEELADQPAILRVLVDIPGLRSRRTSSLHFRGIRPLLRRAASNADITFSAAGRAVTLDVTVRGADPARRYLLQLRDLPHPVKSPPRSYYKVKESTIILCLLKKR